MMAAVETAGQDLVAVVMAAVEKEDGVVVPRLPCAGLKEDRQSGWWRPAYARRGLKHAPIGAPGRMCHACRSKLVRDRVDARSVLCAWCASVSGARREVLFFFYFSR